MEIDSDVERSFRSAFLGNRQYVLFAGALATTFGPFGTKRIRNPAGASCGARRARDTEHGPPRSCRGKLLAE